MKEHFVLVKLDDLGTWVRPNAVIAVTYEWATGHTLVHLHGGAILSLSEPVEDVLESLKQGYTAEEWWK